jgi:hypothetical protein
VAHSYRADLVNFSVCNRGEADHRSGLNQVIAGSSGVMASGSLNEARFILGVTMKSIEIAGVLDERRDVDAIFSGEV